jgi:hypothetical protein
MSEPQMTPISKTVFTFTVLHRTDEPFVGGNSDHPFDNHLGEALRRSWDGHAVGDITSEVTTDIMLPETVRDELEKLGNDGEFFDDDLEEED